MNLRHIQEDSLRVRSIAESKRGESHPLQTSRPQSCTAQRLPEDLAVGWKITLARGGYGDQYELMLQQLLLQGNQWRCLLVLWCLTYKADCIQFCDFRVEAQALSEPSQLLSNVLGISCLGAIEDEGAAEALRIPHGRCSAVRRQTRNAICGETRLEILERCDVCVALPRARRL